MKSRKAAEAQLSGIGDRRIPPGAASWRAPARSSSCFRRWTPAGKDGTIEHVVRWMNPAGLEVVSFKQPTEEELAHDFLWRIRKRLRSGRDRDLQPLPVRGRAGGARPRPGAGERVGRRFERINVFERELATGRHHDREALPAHLRRRAARSAVGTPGRPARSTGSSTRATSTNAPGGATTRRRTRMRSRGAPPTSPPGTSSRPTASGTATGRWAPSWRRRSWRWTHGSRSRTWTSPD